MQQLVSTSGTIFTQPEQNWGTRCLRHSLPAHVRRWLSWTHPMVLRCPDPACHSLRSYEYSVRLWTKNWHLTTTSPELCEHATTIYAPCGIYVHSSTRTLLTPLHVRWYAWNWTTATLFYIKSQSITLAISSVSRIPSLALCVSHHIDRPLHVSVAACTGSQYWNE